MPNRRREVTERLLELADRSVVGVRREGRTTESELSGYRQAAHGCGPADGGPARCDQSDGLPAYRSDPYREAGHGNPSQRQAPNANGADRDATHREQPAECDIPNRYPTAGDTATIIAGFESTGGKVYQRKTQQTDR
jgi:hypothetical protein